jgi:hypothetical protein
MGKSKIDKSEYDKIIEMYNNGMKQIDIANLYGVADNTICNILKKNGVDGRKKISHKEYENIVTMFNDNMLLKDIAKQYNCSISLIRYILQTMNVQQRKTNQNRRVYAFDENYFDSIDTPDKAYILGIFASDGCNMERYGYFSIGLQERDKDVLEKIQTRIGSNHPLYFRDKELCKPSMINGKVVKQSQNAWILQIGNQHACEMLAKHGIMENKTHALQFPDWMDDALLSHYIRGYMDGDGSISRTKNKSAVRFYGRCEFLLGIQNVLKDKLNITMKIKPHNSIYELYTQTKQECCDILDYLYKNATLYMDRKYNIYQSLYLPEVKQNNTQVA